MSWTGQRSGQVRQPQVVAPTQTSRVSNDNRDQLPWYRPTAASKILLAILVLMSVLLISALGLSLFANPKGFWQSAIKPNQYQAVFLTNGQVYFGKIRAINSGYVNLTNIYYLQAQQAVQPQASGSIPQNQPNLSLVKLGNEIHGPEDSMYIERSQVLFWENLKTDGKVAQAIDAYQKNKKPQP